MHGSNGHTRPTHRVKRHAKGEWAPRDNGGVTIYKSSRHDSYRTGKPIGAPKVEAHTRCVGILGTIRKLDYPATVEIATDAEI